MHTYEHCKDDGQYIYHGKGDRQYTYHGKGDLQYTYHGKGDDGQYTCTVHVYVYVAWEPIIYAVLGRGYGSHQHKKH